MDKLDTIRIIKSLSAKPKLKGSSDEKLTEIESIINKYLAEHPMDSDMWLRLVILELNPPWKDPYRMVSYLNTILTYDPYNIQAILALAYIEDYFFGEMKTSTFKALFNLKTLDSELLSMIEYAKAFYYMQKDKEKYVNHLIKSIEYWDIHVNNFKALGRYYLKIGKIEKGKELIKRALDNIQVIYNENYPITDITDIDEFFNYYYKGTHTTEFVKEDLEELLNRKYK